MHFILHIWNGRDTGGYARESSQEKFEASYSNSKQKTYEFRSQNKLFPSLDIGFLPPLAARWFSLIALYIEAGEGEIKMLKWQHI